ncbi:hypothetical protein PVAR5_0376 [Paecilomyces variotii No. 5]|uniref:Xylanolytic transcriptional activator regulatory domain-containing protein n=1 Tax=Byssochlamys spectabilis (strain No. 5 / NBRC 109023) TaxID=1356009 RepID=V5F7I3_BYSSN|nr:hypothetical protein PVAR5_0376 [Paecilomyces variotii No. 5]
MEDIALQLKFLPVIEKRLDEYYSFSQVALVPRPIVFQLLTSIRVGLAASGYITEERNGEISVSHSSQLAKDLLRSSSSDIAITPGLDLGAFCALFSGANVRIETLGLLYTMAARSCLYDISQGYDEHQDSGFIQEMSRYSDLSLRLARGLSPQTTDLITWLAHENLQLMTLLEGDASLGVWRRVGDLATDLLVLGLNREATCSAAPLFLAECRRRTFARAYYLDKVFAAAFNRPPRISARHADCKLPLDLSDDELFTTLQDAKDNITPDGPLAYASVKCKIVAFPEYELNHADEDGDVNPVYKVCDSAVFLEIIGDDGSVIKENGAQGSIVVTNLLKRLQPTIRYSIGDIGEWVDIRSGLFRLKGRSNVGLKIGTALLDRNLIRKLVAQIVGDGVVDSFQTVIRRKDMHNIVIFRIAAEIPTDAGLIPQKLENAIIKSNPSWARNRDAGHIAPIVVEWVQFQDLAFLEASGKLREVIDERF